MVFLYPTFPMILLCISTLIFGSAGIYYWVRQQKTFFGKRHDTMLYILISFFCSTSFLCVSSLGPKLLLSGQSLSEGTNIAFVLDVSKSMNVEDISVKGTNISRILTAKQAISQYVSTHGENAYSLSIFAGSSQGVLPFTTDRDIFLTLLQGVGEQNVAEGGTEVVSGIYDAAQMFTQDEKAGVIVVLSDGGDEYTSSKIPEIQKILKDKNIVLSFVSLGTTRGGYIPLGRDVFGDISYKTYNGRRVISARNDSIASSLSTKFGGSYIVFDDGGDYTNFEKHLGALGKKSQILRDDVGLSLQYHFIILSFLFFLVAFILSIFDFQKLGRRK